MTPPNDELCVMVLTPVGRDAELACIALGEGDVACRTCPDVPSLCAAIREGCGAVLVGEEAFGEGDIDELAAALRDQPAWSDIPVILLTHGGGSAIESAATGHAMERLGNVLLLERPTRVGTLLSLVRTALRARQRQHEIRRKMEELEEAERSLARRSEDLARSNAELQDFAYIASHDLKEPLRGMSNYAHFLLEEEGGTLTEAGRERLRTIQKLTQRMYVLLDSLLEYSRAGRTELALAPQDTGEIVREVVDSMRPWLEERGAEVVVEDTLGTALCDRVRAGQVFANLIANGVKYHDGQAPRVVVGGLDRDGSRIYFVRDNGIGIPSRYHETIFRMFRRLHHRDQYGGGTGAGLALVKRIVERHGGRIWLESEPGRGTTFYFTLAGEQPPSGARAILWEPADVPGRAPAPSPAAAR